MRLRTHDVRDAKPWLIAVAGPDPAQHEHGGADAQRSPARKIERSIAFWRIVDDNHEFRRMSRLVAAGASWSSDSPAATGPYFAEAVLRRASSSRLQTLGASVTLTSPSSARRYPAPFRFRIGRDVAAHALSNDRPIGAAHSQTRALALRSEVYKCRNGKLTRWRR